MTDSLSRDAHPPAPFKSLLGGGFGGGGGFVSVLYVCMYMYISDN